MIVHWEFFDQATGSSRNEEGSRGESNPDLSLELREASQTESSHSERMTMRLRKSSRNTDALWIK